jgi:hypothetical protein
MFGTVSTPPHGAMMMSVARLATMPAVSGKLPTGEKLPVIPEKLVMQI